MVIGRRPDLPVSLRDPSVSRLHALLRLDGGAFFIEDLDSHNGTYINGQRVTSRCRLRSGDRIGIGRFLLRFDVARPGARLAEETGGDLHHTWTYDGPLPHSDLERTSRTYRVLMNLGEFLAAAHTPEEIHAKCLLVVLKLFRFTRACILRIGQGRPVVAATHPAGTGDQGCPCWCSVAVDMHMPLLLHGRSQRSDNVCTDRRCQKTHVAMAVPLFSDEEVLGALYLETEAGTPGFNWRQLQRLALVANLIAIKLSHSQISPLRQELEAAACVQKSLLAHTWSSPAEYEASARLVSSKAVSGDLYEILELAEGRYLYAVGDVVGKGIGAALVMANCLAAIRALALDANDPLQLIRRLQCQLLQCLDSSSFVTLFLGILDSRQHVLQYVNAGHDEPLLLRMDGATERLRSGGPPLGMRVDLGHEMGEVPMERGSLLCVWSDGIPEAFNSKKTPVEFYSVERLLTLLAELQQLPLESLCQRVFKSVDHFVEEAHASDDRTLLFVRRCLE
jgi:hypothetical protein